MEPLIFQKSKKLYLLPLIYFLFSLFASLLLGPLVWGANLDLHSHYIGSITSESVFQLALQNNIEYPLDRLKEIGITVDPKLVIGGSNSRVVKFASLVWSDEQKKLFIQSLQVNDGAEFNSLEKAYARRDPIMRDDKIVPLAIEELGKQMKASDIQYGEYSISSELLGNSEIRRKLLAAAELSEANQGPRIRYLLSIQRSLPLDKIREKMDLALELLAKDEIAGIDIVGFENESLQRIEAELRRFSQKAKRFNKAVMRVHAGESRKFLENIKIAIRAGATRIGHGVYGLDDETLQLAVEREVFFELNPESNYKLGVIDSVAELPTKKLMKWNIPFNINSDGAGIFNLTFSGQLEKLKKSLPAEVIDYAEGSAKKYFESNLMSLRRVSTVPVTNCLGLLQKIPTQATVP